MSDFSSSSSSHSFRFSSWEWREIIVMKILLLHIIMFHIIKHQVISWSTKRNSTEDLGISSPKKSTSMHSRQVINFTVERSNIKFFSIIYSLPCFNSSWSNKFLNCIENSHFDLTFSVFARLFTLSLFSC